MNKLFYSVRSHYNCYPDLFLEVKALSFKRNKFGELSV